MKTTNFDTSLLHDTGCSRSDESQHVELRFMFSKLIYALNHLNYKSRDLRLDPAGEDSGVLFSIEAGFLAVSCIKSGQRTPIALFLEIEDAVEFFLKKLSGGEVTLEVINAVVEDRWIFYESEKVQLGLYSSYRADPLSPDHQKGSCSQLTSADNQLMHG